MQPGTQLAHYEILSAIGKGGMGEVWKARDTKLGREVAIKTLPPEFAQDAERLARFEREAKLLASLNHPNIAAIYGLEEHEGSRFLVLELVEGDTLADRLKRGAIPVEESLKLALQIAEALEAAHEKGVIHRDLKPANIKVTSEGKIKVLDFGLAKAFAGEEADTNLSNSPTLSMQATQAGIILGTAPYMSPEQASGQTTDKRADIWSFGVVLFEMLTARQTFTGETVSHILADVLRTEPEWSSLPVNLHPRIRLLLERCLEKKATDRAHDIADARVDIKKVLEDPDGVFVAPVAEVAKTSARSKLLVLAAVVFGAVIAGIVVWALEPEPVPLPVITFEHDLPANLIANLGTGVLAISPTDDQFVYTTAEGVFLRRMNDLVARVIPGTEGEASNNPFFSPDGTWVGYWSPNEGQLKKVLTSGGAPVVLTEATNTYGGFWTEEGTILYSQSPGGVMQVSEDGGVPIMIAEAAASVYGPVLLPNGQSILFTVGRGSDRRVVVRSLANDEQELLFDDATSWVYYVDSGHLVYAVENDVFVRSFDAATWEVGSQVPLVRSIFRQGQNAAPQFAVSRSGSLVYMPAVDGYSELDLVWVDRNGNSEATSIPTGLFQLPRLSPDAQRVSVDVIGSADQGRSVWIYELDRGAGVPLTQVRSGPSLWSPDGTRVAYRDSEARAVFVRSADGSDDPQRITEEGASESNPAPVSWSPDGETLAIVRRGTASSWDIDMVSIGGAAVPFRSEAYHEERPTFSPNGDWVAYVSSESGERQVYLTQYPSGSGRTVLGQGDEPLWAGNGDLFYRTLDGNIMVVEISTEPELAIGEPAVLFEDRFVRAGPRNYDVTSDGQQLLMVEAEGRVGESEEGLRIIAILNWSEELKERVPVP